MPSDAGGFALPITPASIIIVITYGSILRNSGGIFHLPMRRNCRASAKPNKRDARDAPSGFHLPNIMAARAMNPFPADISRVKDERCPRER